MMVTFADTAFLLALVLKRDVHHDKALAWQRATLGRVLTTEYVLMEFVDALAAKPVRALAATAVAELRGDLQTRVVLASTALFDEGLELFRSHRDKRWSLTDCTSFVVMRREGISDALTSDHDFEQAGFRALLRSEPP